MNDFRSIMSGTNWCCKILILIVIKILKIIFIKKNKMPSIGETTKFCTQYKKKDVLVHYSLIS